MSGGRWGRRWGWGGEAEGKIKGMQFVFDRKIYINFVHFIYKYEYIQLFWARFVRDVVRRKTVNCDIFSGMMKKKKKKEDEGFDLILLHTFLLLFCLFIIAE